MGTSEEIRGGRNKLKPVNLPRIIENQKGDNQTLAEDQPKKRSRLLLDDVGREVPIKSKALTVKDMKRRLNIQGKKRGESREVR